MVSSRSLNLGATRWNQAKRHKNLRTSSLSSKSFFDRVADVCSSALGSLGSSSGARSLTGLVGSAIVAARMQKKHRFPTESTASSRRALVERNIGKSVVSGREACAQESVTHAPSFYCMQAPCGLHAGYGRYLSRWLSGSSSAGCLILCCNMTRLGWSDALTDRCLHTNPRYPRCGLRVVAGFGGDTTRLLLLPLC
jgi:hypothetical protein